MSCIIFYPVGFRLKKCRHRTKSRHLSSAKFGKALQMRYGLWMLWAFYFSDSILYNKLFVYSTKVSLLVQYPGLEPVLDDLLPKKSPLIVAKWFVTFFLLFLWLIIHQTVRFLMFISRIYKTYFWLLLLPFLAVKIIWISFWWIMFRCFSISVTGLTCLR